MQHTDSTHSIVIGYLLWVFGFTGAHRFYYGKAIRAASPNGREFVHFACIIFTSARSCIGRGKFGIEHDCRRSVQEV